MVRIVGDPRVVRCFTNPPADDTQQRTLVVLPGAMAGILSAAALRALVRAGCVPRERLSVVGISAGAGNAVGWATHNAHLTPDVYCHLANRFFTLRWGEDLLQLRYLARYLEECIGERAVRTAPAAIYSAVTDMNGACRLVDIRTVAHPFEAVFASTFVPAPFLGTAHLPRIGRVVDGGCGFDLVQLAIRLRPRYLLVLGSRPLQRELPWYERVPYPWWVRAWLYQYPRAVREGAATIDERISRALTRLSEARRIRFCGIFPEGSEAVAPFEWRSGVLASAAARYEDAVGELIASV